MEFVDYYKILGLSKTATQDDVKKAYRKLARKYHPDVNPDDTAAHKKFQQINEANEVLGDPEKERSTINMVKIGSMRISLSKPGVRKAAGSLMALVSSPLAGAGNPFYSEGFESGHFSDFFESLFGGGGSTMGSTMGSRNYDVEANLTVDLYTALLGGEVLISTPGGKVKLKIKAGTQNGTKIRLKGKGNPVPGREGRQGDLYLTLQVKLPTHLTDQERELFRQLAKLRGK